MSTVADLLCLFSPVCAIGNAGGAIALTTATRVYGPPPMVKTVALLATSVAVATLCARFARDYKTRL